MKFSVLALLLHFKREYFHFIPSLVFKWAKFIFIYHLQNAQNATSIKTIPVIKERNARQTMKNKKNDCDYDFRPRTLRASYEFNVDSI